MSRSHARKLRFVTTVLLSLTVADVLPGCGSDSGGKTDTGVPPTDAAKDVPPIADLPPTFVDVAVADTLAKDDAPITPIDTAQIDVPQIDAAIADLAIDTGSGVDVGPVVDSGGIDGAPATACSSLVNPLYVMSGDTQVPVLKVLGKALRQSANPVTLVWYATGSCTIIDAVYNGTPLKQVPSYIPADATWDPSAGAVPTCALESSGHSIDLGIPIVFPEACTTATPPADLVAFKGPVQSMIFVVPHSASPEAISSEQAKLVFGQGAAGNIAPWLDPNFYFVRPPTKGTQVSLGALIGLPAAQWLGQQINLSPDVATKVASSTSPEKTIGILGSEIYDSATNRASLKALAFQAVGQSNGFLPDSTATAFDKRSLREGHYVAWSHVFYLTKLASADGGAAQPVNASAKLLIDILTNAPNPGIPSGIDPVALVANKGLVPLCAMTVTRSVEGGNLSLFAPPDPCGCYYESKVGTPPASCIACTAAAPCATATTCRHGFCEADDGRTSLSDCSALSSGASHTQIINNACTAGARFESDPIP
jgi:hypothetical protein